MSQDAGFTEAQISYMLAHKDETLVPGMIANVIVCAIATTVFVVLRIVSRTILRRRLHLDLSDWLMVAAWVFYQAFNLFTGLSTRYGAGRHALFVTDQRMLQICSICGEVIYNWAMGFLKLSMLALYGSIFPSRRFSYFLWAVAGVTGAWTLTATFAGIFQCTPIEYGWDRTIKDGHCMQYGVVVMLVSVINIITDFVVLLLPVKPILALKISSYKKKLIILTFAFGSSACIVSVIRLAFTLRVATNDGSFAVVPTSYLSNCELTVGFLATSLPTYPPLWQRLVQRPKVVDTRLLNKTYSGYPNNYQPSNDSNIIKSRENGSIVAGTAMTSRINVDNEIRISLQTRSGQSSPPRSQSIHELAPLSSTAHNGPWPGQSFHA